MSKTNRKRILAPLLIWDTAWKAVAIRRALSRREFKWAAALLIVNSVGLLPMYYLGRSGQAEPVAEEKAA